MNDIRSELAPRGVLRVGLNLSNFLLVKAGPAGAVPTGVAPDLAADIARRLGVPIAWRPYADAGLVAAGALGDPARDEWDVSFMGAEPARAHVIAFTDAYVEIDATYLVRADSPLRTPDDVDRPGVRIATATRAAYTLYLQRTLKHATLTTAESLDGSFQLFERERLDVLAGLKPRLLQDVGRLPGARLLPGRFTAIQQAIATPTGRPAAFAFLKAFADEIRRDGTVERLIVKHGVQGLTVAAPH